MTAADLKNLLERVLTWPEEARDELVAVANQIESELRGQDYLAGGIADHRCCNDLYRWWGSRSRCHGTGGLLKISIGIK